MTKYSKIGLSEMIDSPNGLIKMSALDRHRLPMIWPWVWTIVHENSKKNDKKIENFEFLKKMTGLIFYVMSDFLFQIENRGPDIDADR